MIEAAFDPVEILRVLDRHGVDYVVIGGVAARLWGSPTLTRDLDICPSREGTNLERLAAARADLEARLRVAGIGEEEAAGLAFPLDPIALSSAQNLTLRTRAGDLDIVGVPAGTEGYDALDRNAEAMDIGGFEVRVCALEDLIRMKVAAGRPKDRIEVEVLGAVAEERARRRSHG